MLTHYIFKLAYRDKLLYLKKLINLFLFISQRGRSAILSIS